MMEKTIIEILNSKAINDQYLYELLYELQLHYGKQFFQQECEELESKTFRDLLRFADILSRSQNSKNKNIALKIISLLYDDFLDNIDYRLIAKNVLIKLGNFPSLKLIQSQNNDEFLNLDFEIDYLIKNIFQKTSQKEKIFTDAQYDIFKELTNNNHFSFSATTSFGKSFVFGEYVNWIINSANASQNIAFLVPSRALITQVEDDLKKIISDERYKIITTPEIPYLYRNKKFIFVLTPERLIHYFSKKNPPIFALIIDEAQKVVSDDSRAPIFYHAISLAKQRSINLFFASPNVPNPDLFLNLIGNSATEFAHIHDMNVTRNLFFIDLKSNNAKQYFEFSEQKIKEWSFRYNCLSEAIIFLSQEKQSLIYCNSINDTMAYAEKFSNDLEINTNHNLEKLSEFIRDTIHEKYGLAEMVKKGLAIHFGSLPQIVRVRIEEEYKLGNIRYLFTTSTLLEGVNLPAKNILVLSEKIGNSMMSDLDFRNLIGRAGRLSKELSGNIFIIRTDEKKWNDKSLELLNLKRPPVLESQLLTGKNAFYKKIGQVINGESLSKSTTLKQKKIVGEYASILTYQYQENLDSILSKKLNEKNKNSYDILKQIKKYDLPSNILMTSVTIDPTIQNNIFTNEYKFIFPEQITYGSCKEVLEKLFEIYRWEEFENKNFLGKKNRMGYFATLMIDWINTKPLNVIIKSVIRYYSQHKLSITLDFNKSYQTFDQENSTHLNYIVNQVMRDLETVVRFSIRNYVTNYLQLTNQNESLWRDYLDYGTNKKLVVELQKIGIERQIAIELYNKANEYFILNEANELTSIQEEVINHEKLTDEAKEVMKSVIEEIGR